MNIELKITDEETLQVLLTALNEAKKVMIEKENKKMAQYMGQLKWQLEEKAYIEKRKEMEMI